MKRAYAIPVEVVVVAESATAAAAFGHHLELTLAAQRNDDGHTFSAWVKAPIDLPDFVLDGWRPKDPA